MTNPFRPTKPVDPPRFVGRDSEVAQFKKALLELREGSGTNFVITGERGIGKTSLLTLLHHMARGNVDLDSAGSRFNGLVIHTRLREHSTQAGIAEKIGLRLKEELKTSDVRTKLSAMWSLVSRLQAFGVSLQPAKAKPLREDVLLDQFSAELAATAQRLCVRRESSSPQEPKYDGIVVLLDECDRATDLTSIGSFFKDLLEDTLAKGANHIMICLAGLPSLHSALVNSHRSSLRSFTEFLLGRLSSFESKRLVDKALAFATRRSGSERTISPSALSMIVELTGGHPYYVQRYGHAAFDSCRTDEISVQDVSLGIFKKGGALDIIGNYRFKDAFLESFSASKQQVVLTLASCWKTWLDQSTILEQVPPERANSVKEAINELIAEGVLIKRRGISGEIRLGERSLGLWANLSIASFEAPEVQNEVRPVIPAPAEPDRVHALAYCGYTVSVAYESYSKASEAHSHGHDEEAGEYLDTVMRACDTLKGFLDQHPKYNEFEIGELRSESRAFINYIGNPAGV